jgi:protein O-GlcNAc transferase
MSHQLSPPFTISSFKSYINTRLFENTELIDHLVQIIKQQSLDSIDEAKSFNQCGVALYQLNLLPQALICFQHAVSNYPEFSYFSNLGLCALDLNQFKLAIQSLEKAYRLAPQQENAANNLLSAYISAGLLQKGLSFAKDLLHPNHPHPIEFKGLIHHNYGQVLSKLGLGEEASIAFNEAYRLGQTGIKTEHNRLYQYLYHELDPKIIANAHIQWGEDYQKSINCDQSEPSINTNRKESTSIKQKTLAFISPDFRRHSVAYFFNAFDFHAAIWQDFNIICYYTYHQHDDFTDLIKSQVDLFYQANQWQDDDFITQIKKDQVDILIDLAGHTSGNRLSVFARKPAPIQITWLGYPSTTGLSTMDYRIVDENTDPVGNSDLLHTEKLLRLPCPFLCYQPPMENGISVVAHSVVAHHQKRDDLFYFASFNNPAKISDITISLWSSILIACPHARLILKGSGLDEPDVQEIELSRFDKHGVQAHQIIFLGRTNSNQAHFECYQQVDLALDTFPYCGTTTTCEALWMGVPVLTLVGDSHVSRVGYSLLKSVSLDEFIAFDIDQYVQKAIDWANPKNKEVLRELKSILRAELLQSDLCNRERFNLHFRDLLLGVSPI